MIKLFLSVPGNVRPLVFLIFSSGSRPIMRKNRSLWRQSAQIMKRQARFRRRDGRGVSSSKSCSVSSTTPSFQSLFNTSSRMFSLLSSTTPCKNHAFRFSKLPLTIVPKRTTVLLVIVAIIYVSDVSSSSDVFSNSFLVRFRRDVEQHEAHEIANKHGFVNVGPVS